MSKLKGLLLTQGMHGMISQVEGLAKALDIEFIHYRLKQIIFGKLFLQDSLQFHRVFIKK